MEKCLHPSTYQFKIETFGVILKDSEILESVMMKIFFFHSCLQIFHEFWHCPKNLGRKTCQKLRSYGTRCMEYGLNWIISRYVFHALFASLSLKTFKMMNLSNKEFQSAQKRTSTNLMIESGKNHLKYWSLIGIGISSKK